MMNERVEEPLTWITQVERWARIRPLEPAIRFEGATTTWGWLSESIRRLAGTLASRGVSAGDRVAILMTNHVEHVVSVLAAQALGAIAVPINFRLAEVEVEFIVEDCGVSVIVVDGGLAGLVAGARSARDITCIVSGDEGIDAAGPGAISYDQAVRAEPHPGPIGPRSADDRAFIMYTSGTTGRPKGAVLTYANLMANTLCNITTTKLVHDDEVHVVASPLFHTAGFGMLVAPLVLGHLAVILPTGAFDPQKFAEMLETERVTNVFLVPSQWQLVCDSGATHGRSLRLRRITWGAAPASETTLRTMQSTFPGVEIYCYFGQTEMSPTTTMLRSEDAVRKIGSVGKPVQVVSVRIVDEDMKDVPEGEVGEIVYRGATTMLEYWENPEATAEAFRGGWFHSGDLVRRDDEGFIYVVDRLKDMIISGGENVYSAEVENVLAGHPNVAEAAIFGVPDERWGETPVAVVALRDAGQGTTAEELIKFSQEHLASYKKPTRVEFVDQLPRNAAGKVLKQELRSRFLPVSSHG